MPSYKTKYRYRDQEDELTEKLHGKQHKLDKNKNGRLDKQDFKMLRKEDNEEQLYEVEFEKEIEFFKIYNERQEESTSSAPVTQFFGLN